ncbi:hypothetical protein P171DRAFT_516768 [Karstenula rhodostoma CBS 690.94]|uniref:Acyltransferase 3 domain-containing protein n=1 Tax=Karstenula rhodostoma CBS 690.94 TaxID=1392251 RepID=A0A9P4PY79_9PLEO|nr:hypothetical protein P171DRAFT_516768 [Karstenula rhodostoma CBS 690.94]
MPRTHSLDNLRTFLTVLVILHHASIPYSGLGSWPYEPSPNSPSAEADLSTIVLILFNIINQTFSMALFFLISGYFSAMAAEKRGRRVFLKEKGMKLGVPCAVYSIFVAGFVEGIIAVVRDGAGWRYAVRRTAAKGVGVRGARGPVWYVGVVLVFDLVFAFTFYPQTKQDDTREAKPPAKTETQKPHISHLHDRYIFSALAASALATFLLRTRWPIGTTFTPLGVDVGFLPQYIVYYATGIYAHRALRTELHRLVPRFSIRVPRALTAVRTMLAVLLVTIYTAFTFTFLFMRREADLLGGFNILAAWYAVFNETLVFLICVALLRLFGEGDWAKRKWSVALGREGWEVDVARWGYAAFLVHGPVVVGVQSQTSSPPLITSTIQPPSPSTGASTPTTPTNTAANKYAPTTCATALTPSLSTSPTAP